AGIKDSDNSRMFNTRQCFDFLQKLFAEPRFSVSILQKLYDNRTAVQLKITRELDDADSAAAEFLFDQVARSDDTPFFATQFCGRFVAHCSAMISGSTGTSRR